MKQSHIRFGFAVCLALTILALPAFPQSQVTGNVTGRAMDASGALIPGVEVSVSSPAMIGGARTAITDETGSYRFTLLPSGTYRVSFTLTGFKTLNVDGVNVTPNQTMTINANLEVASTAEEVTVTSQAPAIDLEAATVAVNFDARKLDNLPYARSLTALNAMIPGVFFTGSQYDVGGSQFGTGSAVGGKTYGRTGNNVMAIDGLVWCQGYADYGSFEEVNFSTASKGADQANAGVTMQMIVKSGGNQFHGNFTTQYERGSFQAKNIDQALLDQGLPPGSNKFVHLRNFYGDIGGPIKKDKFWFYFSYMDGTLQQFVPGYIDFSNGEPGVFVSKLQNPTTKLTYQLNSKMKLEASWPLNLKTQPYRNASNRVPLQATQNQHSWATYGPNLKWTNIISSKMTATASINRGGYWWPDDPWSGSIDAIRSNLAVASTGIPTIANANDVRRLDTTTNATLGPQLLIYRRPIRWTWTGDVSRFSTLAGKNNEFKVGYTGWWTKSYTTNFGYPNQQIYRYKSVAGEDYTVTTPENMLGVFQHSDNVQVIDYPNTTISAFGYKSFYVNDKITLSRKLNFTAGLRMDYFNSWLPTQGRKGLGPRGFLPDGQNSPLNGASGANAPDFSTPFTYPNIPSSKFPSYTKFVPRFSVAYDVTGTGKLAFKASYGRYTAYSSGIGAPLPSSSTINPNATTTVTYNGWKGDIPFRPFVGNYSTASVSGGGGTSRAGFNASDPGTWPNRLSNDLDSDYLDEYTAGLDIGISRNYGFRFNVIRKFDYVRNKTVDVAQPYDSWTDLLTYYYSLANNKVVQVTGTTTSAQAASQAGEDAKPVYVWSVPKSYPSQGQVDTLVVNRAPGEGKAQFTAYEFTFNKQSSDNWGALASYVISMGHTNPVNPNTPNEAFYQYANPTITTNPTAYGPTTWDQAIKLNGTYQLPFGFMWATTFTAQSGTWIHQGVQIKDNLGKNVTQITQYQFQRLPWVSIWDQRFSKRIRITERQTIEGAFDLYNSLNTNTVTGVSTTFTGVAAIGTSNFNKTPSGSFVLKPSDIVSPRIFQLTAKYRF